MEATPPANQTSIAEKLRAMEALWVRSSCDEAQFESPAWHGDALRDREEHIKTGRESFMDWEAAKKQLRERLT
jgi:hypothetical protein